MGIGEWSPTQLNQAGISRVFLPPDSNYLNEFKDPDFIKTG